MPFVLTLIAAPDFADFPGFVTTLQQRLASMEKPVWLHPGQAVDLELSQSDHQAAEDFLQGQTLDYAFQASEARRRKILIADMDSTMIGQECIDELAAEVGLKDKVAAITAAAMRGEIEFESALRERVALLKGLPESVIDDVIQSRITLTPGGTTLVATMKKHGAYTALVSGGFTAFTNRVSSRIGFDENRANTLNIADGVLTGTVQGPILGKQAKIEALQDIAKRLGITPQQAMAVGDGANDLGMIQLAGLGVAIHAKPAVAAEADVRIEYNDLSALLYLQGYARTEWVVEAQ
ncbi:MAG: phosphoserine phosphatase SerB [Hyphomicrobiales bacterium]